MNETYRTLAIDVRSRWRRGVTFLETVIVIGLGGVIVFGLVVALRAGGTFSKNAQDAQQLKRDASFAFLTLEKAVRSKDSSTLQISSASTLYLDRNTANEKYFMKQGGSLIYSDGARVTTLANNSLTSVQFAFLSGDRPDGSTGNNRLQVTLQLAKGKATLTQTTIILLRNEGAGSSFTVTGT